jgi:hydrogenase maturation protease
MHLAYQVLEGYRVLVVVDTTHGDGPPGSLYLLEHDLAAMTGDAAFDPHGMEPDAVLELIGALARGIGTHGLERVLVLGCEPAHLGEGMGLTSAVAGAVDEAADAVRRLVERLTEGRPPEPLEPRTKETTDEDHPRGGSAARRRLGGEGVDPRRQAVPAPARDVAGHRR